jgi:hypothetical protein
VPYSTTSLIQQKNFNALPMHQSMDTYPTYPFKVKHFFTHPKLADAFLTENPKENMFFM